MFTVILNWPLKLWSKRLRSTCLSLLTSQAIMSGMSSPTVVLISIFLDFTSAAIISMTSLIVFFKLTASLLCLKLFSETKYTC